MIEEYGQNDFIPINENERYINREREREYPYQSGSNELIYSNNGRSDYNNYSNNFNNNFNNYSQNYNNYNSYNNINEGYSQNSIITEKRDETLNSINSLNNNNQSKTIDSSLTRYFSKVTVENIRQPKDIKYILDNFLTENNYPKNYEVNIEKKKISFLFYEEEIAFNFTKLLNNIKNKNVLYMEMNVHLSLTPNNNYNKTKDGKIKRRGLSIDSIQRLFNGLGSKKQEKKSKINANLDLGVSSPFLFPYEKKRQKSDNKSKNNSKNKNNKKENLYSNIKLKDYNRLPIRVLDTEYTPLKDYIFRTDAKDKWISPSNFKI